MIVGGERSAPLLNSVEVNTGVAVSRRAKRKTHCHPRQIAWLGWPRAPCNVNQHGSCCNVAFRNHFIVEVDAKLKEFAHGLSPANKSLNRCHKPDGGAQANTP
ncbi:unannotated protein [freshwater metagenome]|uniref:Unannotated protein n=1 Tax=freshwater metagenome TaxID=449393 RepID=A0A6J6V3N8_9ZZZZ